LSIFIHDTRFPLSFGFAKALAARGVKSHGIEGDVTALWYDDLYHGWRSAPRPLAGVTAHGAFFCLERLAWDAGMRVVLRCEHRSNGDMVAHEVSGAASLVARVSPAAIARRGVGQVIAATSLQMAGDPRAENTARRQFQTPDAVNKDPAYMVSWIIAPRV
jgi:hypothetical protein